MSQNEITTCLTCSAPHLGERCDNPGCPESGNVTAWDASKAKSESARVEVERFARLQAASFESAPVDDEEAPATQYEVHQFSSGWKYGMFADGEVGPGSKDFETREEAKRAALECLPVLVEVVNIGTEQEPKTRVSVDGVIVARGSEEELEPLLLELVAHPDKARAIRDAFRAFDPVDPALLDDLSR